MDNLFTAAFEAHNHERNHHRRYRVTVGRDLFGDWTVCIHYGRTGQAGRELHFAATEATALQRVVRDRLRRRLSAPKRIGTPYRLVALHATPEFDTAAWLSDEVMAGLTAHPE